MTTRLNGKETFFLPFNRGTADGGAGNPRAEDEGSYATAYLWEQVWQRESWLEIIARYLVTKRDEKKRITSVLFPRYHQLDATRKLVQAVLRLRGRHNRQLPAPAEVRGMAVSHRRKFGS